MIAILLADGFEEIEALTPLDVLKRAGLDARTVAIGSKIAAGSHGIPVICDMTADEVKTDELTAVIFPGGMPGSLNLDASPFSDTAINAVRKNGGIIAAICAAPLVLGRRGLLDGKRAVCYPGFEKELIGATVPEGVGVVIDGNVITAKGMGVATEFALALVEKILGKKKADEIADAIMYERDGKCVERVDEADLTDVVKEASATTLERNDINDCNNYKFPPIEYLKRGSSDDGSSIDAEITETAEKLIETLVQFNVSASIKSVDRGPRITRYELALGKGVRVSHFTSLADDIALCLGSENIRIIAPIPGKTMVGVEVPNKNPSTVFLGDLIASDEFKNEPSKTFACIGKNVSGDPVFADVAKLPHVLVAGATGMGKSVCINSIVASILYKATPDEVKLIMIDPKEVEFTMYNGIPHLLVPVITGVNMAVGALSWAVDEMNRRYDLLASANARRLDSYNDLVREDPSLGKPLPKIIIVIDELNDLMMQARRPIESLILAITQKARAAGIHMIIGTQRPSVDVITGVVKANIPSRISCKVSSSTDSRNILDRTGAEKLLNKGDMLVEIVGQQEPIRVQGAFVSDGEIQKITDYLKSLERNTENDGIIGKMQRAGAKYSVSTEVDDDDEDDEDLSAYLKDKQFIDAVDVAIKSGKISTSFIQRKISVGYGKAAKFIDVMEDLGIISAPCGLKPRDVLFTEDEWEEMIDRSTIKTDDDVLSTEEIADIVKKFNFVVASDDEISQSDENALSFELIDDDSDGEEEIKGYLSDKLFLEAVDLAIKQGKISTSLIQRKISIGYGKAAKFIDIMEELGLVSEPCGQKPRDVLVTKNEWEEMLNRMKDSDN